jgi:phage head maturation protease
MPVCPPIYHPWPRWGDGVVRAGVLGRARWVEWGDEGLMGSQRAVLVSDPAGWRVGLRAGAYGSSFRFNVLAEDFLRKPGKSAYNPSGLPERTVREVHMPEFGPVTFPAYPGATAGMRSLTDRFYPLEDARSSRRAESVFEEFLQLIER